MFSQIAAYVVTIGFLFSLYLVIEAMIKPWNKPSDVEKGKKKWLQEKHEVDSYKDLVFKLLFFIFAGVYGLKTYAFAYVVTSIAGLFK